MMITCEKIATKSERRQAWGEIDHMINYPDPSEVQVCREQLRVLSRLVGAAT
jgi:putative GTP pyrophosphokinase